MGAAYFYHLTRRPMEETLAMLLGKATANGWRVAVRGTDAARLAWLDERLWLGADDGFLPHGVAGGPHDADQPILLTTGPAANAPHCVMSVDGATVAAEEVGQLDRVCVLFDGNDPGALDVARGQWKTLNEAGAAAQYWSEESGRWEMKAQT
ncbi:MAG: DNA polymerase III subunit chi [Pseudomonadota bacterium]